MSLNEKLFKFKANTEKFHLGEEEICTRENDELYNTLHSILCQFVCIFCSALFQKN